MNKYTYAQLRDIGRKYYKDANFCGVIALAINCGISYGKAFHLLRRHGRKTGKGSPWNALWQAYRDCGYSLVSGYPRHAATLHAYAKKALAIEGNFLIHTAAHVSALNHRELVDWSGEFLGKNKRVKGVWKILPL